MARTKFQHGRSIIGPSIATDTFRDPIQKNIPSSNHSLRQYGSHLQENFLIWPIGDEAAQFTNFLGTIAKSGKDAPLTYKDWRHMPLDNKKRKEQGVVPTRAELFKITHVHKK
uniref:Uncharacterized protein n=1 Tax=Ananas comosus var. bracteatus TaxID=296719 RepID=A0A6V7PSF5_ANACO|nr:unnamed protein product [Ananas comosus var. bracteatus]